jgi:hypothetical protein
MCGYTRAYVHTCIQPRENTHKYTLYVCVCVCGEGWGGWVGGWVRACARVWVCVFVWAINKVQNTQGIAQ